MCLPQGPRAALCTPLCAKQHLAPLHLPPRGHAHRRLPGGPHRAGVLRFVPRAQGAPEVDRRGGGGSSAAGRAGRRPTRGRVCARESTVVWPRSVEWLCCQGSLQGVELWHVADPICTLGGTKASWPERPTLAAPSCHNLHASVGPANMQAVALGTMLAAIHQAPCRDPGLLFPPPFLLPRWPTCWQRAQARCEGQAP